MLRILCVQKLVSMKRRCTGATVMPHNIILHSSLIQTRNYPRTTAGKRMAVRVRPARADPSWVLCWAGSHCQCLRKGCRGTRGCWPPMRMDMRR